MADHVSAPGLDLSNLKARLASLGVDVTHPPAQAKGFSPDLPRRAHAGPQSKLASKNTVLNIERGKQEVSDLLDRVHRVEKAISSAEGQAAAAQQALGEEIAAGQPPESSRSPSQSRSKRVQQPAAAGNGSAGPAVRQSAPFSTAKGLVAAVRSSAHMKSIPAHTPLSTVLSQFKEAEEAWAHEKARLRREALTERKRANKTELEARRLERLAEHRCLELKALKTALKNRDSQLVVAEGRIRELEDALARVQEDSAARIGGLNAEHDDLKALLLATLQRLEAVDEVVARADHSSAVMEDKMRSLEDERLRALEAAARARTQVAELTESRRKLQWQSKLLEKMSEVQLKHNKRKSEAIKRLLNADEAVRHHGAAGAGGLSAEQLAALSLDDDDVME